MVYCDYQVLFVVYCDHQVCNPFFALGLCSPSYVEMIVVVVWICVYPSCVEVIVLWLSALSLLC